MKEPRPVPSLDDHWVRLGYVVLTVLLVVKIRFLAVTSLELCEDEAYQWLWSKHLALSYYSKPPMIALCHWLGTHLFGDREFGIRMVPTVISFVLGILVLRFARNATSGRSAFFLLVTVTATPLLAVGSLLLVVDDPAVLFCTLTLLAGWKALQTGRLSAWVWTGVWMAGAGLTKFLSPLLWASLALYFMLSREHRRELRRPGIYVAVAVSLLSFAPVIFWNAQHGWITFQHLKERGGLAAEAVPGAWLQLHFTGEFLVQVAGLLNPVFFVMAVWAAVRFWKSSTDRPLARYAFAFAAPTFLLNILLSLHSRVQPNWIAPGIIPLFLLATLFWHERPGAWLARRGLQVGSVLGLAVVLLVHDTSLVKKITGNPLPVKFDPTMTRLRGARELAALVEGKQAELAATGRPVFLIADHYGRASLLNFYLAGGREAASRGELLCHVISSPIPKNQYWFWPGYAERKGQNALFIREMPDEKSGRKSAKIPGAVRQLREEFRDVKSVGVFDIMVLRSKVSRVQLWECTEKF